jgi:hypothetical protein
MTDEFDTFLRAALEPEERRPDRSFVARIHAEIAFDRDLAALRHRALRKMATDLLALGGLTSGLLWVVQAPEASTYLLNSGVALAVVVGMFGLVATIVATLSAPSLIRRIA